MRVLCLDIGTTSAKAVEVLSTFGRIEIIDRYERKVLGTQDPVTVAGELLHQDIPEKPSKLVVFLRSNRTTYRRFVFPTRDKSVIRSSVQFELEDDLPFEPGSFIYDFAAIRQGKTSQSSVFVAASLKQTLTDYLGKLESNGIDPDYLIPEALSYRALVRSIRQTTPETTPPEGDVAPVFVLNLGQEHSTLYASYQDIPIMCRELAWGGREIAGALSQSYQLNDESAEKTKIHHGFVLPASQIGQVTQDQLRFSEVVYRAMQPLLAELKQADLACKAATGMRADRIYLCGGTSLLPGLPAVIAEETRTPTQFLKGFSQGYPTKLALSESEQVHFAAALGGACAVLPIESDFKINFRKGAFGKKSANRELNANIFDGALKVATFFGFFLWVIFGLQAKVYETRLTETDEKLASAVRSFFSGVTSGELKNYMANEAALRRGIDNELKTQREMEKLLEPGTKTPSLFLKTISSNIPRDVVVDLTNYQVGSSAQTAFLDPVNSASEVSLVFRVPQPQNIDRLEQILSPLMNDLKKSESKSVTGKDGVKKFEVSFKGTMKERR